MKLKTNTIRPIFENNAFKIELAGPNYKNYEFSGGFNINGKSFAIKEVIYSNPATIVFWDDNTKTVAKCSPVDEYSPETGLAICVLKKIVGGAAIKNMFDDWIPTSGNRVALKDVRRKHE